MKTERWIPGLLKGIPVSALPDNCSDQDVLSETFVTRIGFSVDTNFQRPMRLPNGNVITSVGTVTLPFSFDGERESYERVFTILPRSVHDAMPSRLWIRFGGCGRRLRGLPLTVRWTIGYKDAWKTLFP